MTTRSPSGRVHREEPPAHIDAAAIVETLEFMSDGYFTLDHDWRFTFVNGRALTLFRKERDEVLGHLIWDVFPEAYRSEFHDAYERALASGEPVVFEDFYAPLDGWFEIRAHPAPTGLSVYFVEVSQRHRADEERARLLEAEQRARRDAEAARLVLEHAAMHDPLTGLANRPALCDWITAALATETGRKSMALFFLDLDHFKYVNDSLGHRVGDDLLIEMGARLGRELERRPSVDGIVARVGGDEFAIGANFASGEDARDLLDGILQAIAEPAEIHGRRLVTTTSVGVAYPAGSAEATADSLLRDADAALYKAKGRGRNQAARFDETLRVGAIRRIELEAELRTALAGDEIGVAYQPVFDLRSGHGSGVEALARWHHPTRGMVAPVEFIPIAEDTGLILKLGQRVLDIVGRGLTARVPVPGEPAFNVWVNVSGRQLVDPAFYRHLRESPVFRDRRLGLEVTETVLLQDPRRSAVAIGELVDAGVKIAIDDFGTGYSSLARLTDYPIHVIKIDRSFVAGIDEALYRSIVASTIQLAHGLHAEVVAEGVETVEQLAVLRELGCDQVSGYYLARPVPREELRAATVEGLARLHT